MTWFPIGPDFIYTPRDLAQLRLSRRNQYARQCQIWGIAVDPNNSNVIYTVDQDVYKGLPMPKGGSGAFRTDDGGSSWVAISDSLQQANFALNPSCIAVHPVNGNYVYMGTDTGEIYVSSNKGGAWGAPVTPSTSIKQIVVDPRNAANPATTTIYAGTPTGVFVSTDGGASWGAMPVLAGVVSSMAFYLPAAGTPACYVGIWAQGVYYSTNPATAAWAPVTGPGLPAAGTFEHAWVDYCQANPSRAYAYFESVSTGTVALCTTGNGNNAWKKINSATIPASSGLFAVAPNSPGDGNGDILFLGHLYLSRSTDAGQTWVVGADQYHVDQRSAAFAPPKPPPGTIPLMLIGNDGGLIGSTRFADPTYSYGTAPTDFSDGTTYTNSGVAQNLNHGKMSAALHQYNADPSASAIGYIVCDDTGLSAHTGALGWRGLGNADGDQVACTPGSDGVKIWANLGFPYATFLITDTGVPGDVPWTLCKLGASNIASTSNHVLTLDKKCVTGIQAGPIVRIDQSGVATQISQVFAQPVKAVAASTVDGTLFCCATQDNRVFVTSGVVPGPATVWSEAATGKPSGTVASVAIDVSGNVYALMAAVPAGSATPLYKISGGAWTAQASNGLPGLPYGRLVADPVTAGTLYAVSGGRVYRLVLAGAAFTWTEVGPGLPGPHVDDLWIGKIAANKVLLRAAVGSRGMWETDVTAGAADPPARPYLRDNLLDQGWLTPSPEGLVNPYRPADGISVFHYQSADIKVDAQQPGPPAFFQTDPEGTLPLSHVLFDVLNDNSQNLPGSDAAMVHIQVHNRSNTPLDNVNVWAIYASAAAGVPGLNKSASMGNAFPFWDQFKAGGAIVPNLPADSPWTAIGAPMTLSGIDASHPRVASWSWTVPPFVVGDPGHYCVAAFVHSAQNPVGETSNYSVDSVTPTNPQIGQKNLHVVAALAAARSLRVREYIEFHNPDAKPRVADLVFDLRPLPPQLQVWLRLSELKTEAPLEESLTGIETTHRPALADRVKAALLAGVEEGQEILDWLERWLDRFERELGGTDDDDRPCHKPHPGLRFTPPIYRAKPASLVSVKGVQLPPHGASAALLVMENHGELPEGSEYTFQVQQVVRERVVGGSTYVIRIAGPREPERIESFVERY
ncbi:MAG TPA: hypothetical protein VF101_18750 [Gaiellaceae bacterium]